MREPLLTRNGQSFERNAILAWLECHGNQCPLTRNKLNVSDLIRNRALKARIEAWYKGRGIDLPDDDSESENELDIPEADVIVGEVDKDDGASTDDEDNFDWNNQIESVYNKILVLS